MATSLETLQVLVGQLDAAVTAVQAVVKGLQDQVANNVVTPDQLTGALQPEIDKLNALVPPPAPPVG